MIHIYYYFKGQYELLFGYSSWKQRHTNIEILHIKQQERLRKKEEKRLQKEKEVREKNEQELEAKREADRQRALAETIAQAEQEAIDKAKEERWRKLKGSLLILSYLIQTSPRCITENRKIEDDQRSTE